MTDKRSDEGPAACSTVQKNNGVLWKRIEGYCCILRSEMAGDDRLYPVAESFRASNGHAGIEENRHDHFQTYMLHNDRTKKATSTTHGKPWPNAGMPAI